MSNIEAIIFDLGNVLIAVDEQRMIERFCARAGKSQRELQDYIMATPFVNQLALGQLTGQRFFEIVAGDLGFDGGYDEFAEIWSDIFSPIEPMIELVGKLKGKLKRLALSNTNQIHMDFVFPRYPFLRDMDGVVLSHEVGLMKPDRRIYELALSRYGLTAARTVFVDDILANVEGARSVGMAGIHHRSAEATRAELTKLGVTPI
jgi:putative hydrolase of the HAD superfamily